MKSFFKPQGSSKLRLRLPGIILIILTCVSIILCVIGIRIINKTEENIQNNVSKVKKNLQSNSVNANNQSSYILTGEKYSANFTEGIAIITFCNDNNRQVAVFNGTNLETLKNGAGRDINTVMPNEPGNCVVYAHRDSGFKSLTTIKKGDMIEVMTVDKVLSYNVLDVLFIKPEDARIYESSQNTRITLVTCYPFSYVGPAPLRCVVIAEAK